MTSGNTEHAFNRWIDLVIRAHCPECGARRLRSSWWFVVCGLPARARPPRSARDKHAPRQGGARAKGREERGTN